MSRSCYTREKSGSTNGLALEGLRVTTLACQKALNQLVELVGALHLHPVPAVLKHLKPRRWQRRAGMVAVVDRRDAVVGAPDKQQRRLQARQFRENQGAPPEAHRRHAPADHADQRSLGALRRTRAVDLVQQVLVTRAGAAAQLIWNRIDTRDEVGQVAITVAVLDAQYKGYGASSTSSTSVGMGAPATVLAPQPPEIVARGQLTDELLARRIEAAIKRVFADAGALQQ